MRLPQYKITQDRRTMLVLLGLDAAAGIVVFNIIANFRGIAPHPIFGPLLYPLLLLAAAIFLIDGYNGRTDMLSVDYLSLHTIAVLAAMVATLLLTFVVFPEGYELHSSRGVIALGFIVLIPVTVGYRRLICMQAASGRGGSNFVFVGGRQACQAFREECWRMGMQQAVIHSEVGDDETPGSAQGKPDALHRSIESVLADAATGAITVEAIVLGESGSELPAGLDQQLVRLFFQGVPTYTLEFFHQVYWHKIPLNRLDSAWLFQEGFRITREPVFERIKRVTDILFSAFGLILASPVFLVAIPAIWLSERDGVFYFQSRIGKNGVPFKLAKLKTMRSGSDTLDPYTAPDDARVTAVGRLLRATRLDELPQLWNVLKGDMSLIGPRAEWDRLAAGYEQKIHCYYFRHLVKPGITGWAQVNYRYGANLDDTIRKLEYDLYYIRYFSFRLDASIFLKTIHIMLFGKGR